ncbi:glycosyl hydrolase 115 family protein [Lewinella sp. IMCC34183]|uniref:glycosyl hydrolase 115 family protein n=1 Tax=Lewinella sp. IMCC34183 TaxID=2248762 RepID=UPI0018E51B84|nr:glycosyl hydrolase 115 family protein [Lewinella sp. IMCC34183]
MPLQAQGRTFEVFAPGRAPALYLESGTDSLLRWAAEDLATDLEQLSGQSIVLRTTGAYDPARPGIYIGLAGGALVRSFPVTPTAELPTGWEAFALREANGSLLVTGSDVRGTVYGIFDLAERLGISPWKWWADVAVTPRDRAILELPAEGISEAPGVRYRGIFLNDEDWGLQPWAAATFEPEIGDIGPRTYERIFQLLLRLKANTIWPAMHPSTQAFFTIPGNREMAERYQIYVGSSHAEPMLRNNVGEWDHERYGAYNYLENADTIRAYWGERVAETTADNYLYTVGMRGIHDSGMEGDATTEERVELLDKIIADQRAMLEREKGTRAAEIPQFFVPYKEVLELYDAGLEVPEDVTLVWTDDNYGYIRRLSEDAERERSGGSGVYYHLSYWGRPHDYLWLSTIQPGLIWYEMQRAYANGARNIWIANVGDIKPGEYSMEFFLDLAWDPESIGPDDIHDHLTAWAAREFGSDVAGEVAALLSEHYRLAMLRKPEYMGWSQTEPTTGTAPAAFTTANGDELQRRIDAYRDLYERSKALAGKLGEGRRDAYFQLVDYPVRGAALLNETYGYAKQALLARDNGERQRLRKASRTAHDEIGVLTRYYNTLLAGGKWAGMMNAAPRGLPVFDEPDFSGLAAADYTVEPAGDLPEPLTLPAAGFGDHRAPVGFRWQTVTGLGYGGAALTLLPATTARFTDDAPYVEYSFEVERAGTYTVEIRCLPTHANDFDHELRARFNGGKIYYFSLNTRGRSEAWKEFVLGNHVPATFDVTVDAPGTQTLKLYVNQTGIVIDQLAVYPAGYPDFYELRR